jgi:hypothetical protein
MFEVFKKSLGAGRACARANEVELTIVPKSAERRKKKGGGSKKKVGSMRGQRVTNGRLPVVGPWPC